jgi:hypothetical protein
MINGVASRCVDIDLDARLPARPTSWDTFLRAHWGAISGADFFTTDVWTWRGLVTYYTVFVIELATRRVQVVGSTPHPNDAFMIQAARTMTALDDGALTHCRVLICDRDRSGAPLSATCWRNPPYAWCRHRSGGRWQDSPSSAIRRLTQLLLPCGLTSRMAVRLICGTFRVSARRRDFHDSRRSVDDTALGFAPSTTLCAVRRRLKKLAKADIGAEPLVITRRRGEDRRNPQKIP